MEFFLLMKGIYWATSKEKHCLLVVHILSWSMMELILLIKVILSGIQRKALVTSSDPHILSWTMMEFSAHQRYWYQEKAFLISSSIASHWIRIDVVNKLIDTLLNYIYAKHLNSRHSYCNNSTSNLFHNKQAWNIKILSNPYKYNSHSWWPGHKEIFLFMPRNINCHTRHKKKHR